MITKTVFFLATVAIVTATCHIEPSCKPSLPKGKWSHEEISQSWAPEDLSGCVESKKPEGTIAAPRSPGRIVSNKCDCVKTILRSKPVTRVSVVPTERRVLQTVQVRPVVRRVQYDFSPPLYTGPSSNKVLSTSNSHIISSPLVVKNVNDDACEVDKHSRGDIDQSALAFESSDDINTQPELWGKDNIVESAPVSASVIPRVQSASATIVKPSPSGRIVSNKCDCVKTILLHKPVTRVVVVPSERRIVQTFTKPVVRKVQYKFTPELQTGPAPKVNLALGSAYSSQLVAAPLENVQLTREHYPEINTERVSSDLYNCDSGLNNYQSENWGQDFENLSQLPSCL